MAINYDKLMSTKLPEKEFSYTTRDTMLYALGVGMGADPMDRKELPFVFEMKELKAVPTQATVIAWDDSFIFNSGINVVMVVHGEQKITLHRPLPTAATVVAQSRLVDIFDKGAGKGAILLMETAIRDKKTGELLCTNNSTAFARGDGGFGGRNGSGPAPHAMPERKPDHVCSLKTRPDHAFLYALSGDRNPLHRDPDVAAAAGFPRPIIQGLCTYGHACHAVLKSVCDYRSERIADFAGRFTAPVYPGETIDTEIWQDGNIVSFRCQIPERKVTAINNGKVTLRD
ncbi:MAG TPA: MaoC/PaaZ C-terminal domain-containing protein [Candidatus Sulfotelmatobacter sp.]|nr:MaoC/PaaZ C-terminal domain-containing protein [Candidatus Sulfotelmatobacter sp.]